MRKFNITEDELEVIADTRCRLDNISDFIQDICASDREPMEVGFELGKLWHVTREALVDITNAEISIRNANRVLVIDYLRRRYYHTLECF